MVHALQECWRALAPGGALIDLRPVSSNPPLELVVGDQVIRPGAINDQGGLPDDLACDAALIEVLRCGAFRRESREGFIFDYYWESLEDLLAYVAERWCEFAYVPAAVADGARHAAAGIAGPYRARIRRTLQLGVYKKRLTSDAPSRQAQRQPL